MDKLEQYFRDTIAELKQVKWPTQNQTMVYTVLVVATVAVVAVFVGIWDYVFATGIKLLTNSL